MILLVKDGNLKTIIEGLSTRLYSTIYSLGLEVTLEDLKTVDSKVVLAIRPFEKKDINTLDEGLRHVRLVEENIPDCYVGTTNKGTVVYRQWLFKAEQNKAVTDYFGDLFPKIKENEALIEGVFTHPEFRGLRIMPNAVFNILKQKQYTHIKRVVVFVDVNNKPSLKGFRRNNFKPYIMRRERWFFFKRTVTFDDVSSEILKSYSDLIPVV